MAPGLTSNPAVSAALWTTAASFTAKFAFASHFAAYPFYAIFLGVLPLVISSQLAYHAIIYPRFLTPLKNLPVPSDAQHWLWGHEKVIIFDSPRGAAVLRWIKEIKPENGLLRIMGLLSADRVIVTNPKALADVLNNNCYDFEKPLEARTFLARIIGWGLILVEGDMHKLQRKTMLPSFTINQIKALYPVFWDKTNVLIDALARSIQDDHDPGNSAVPEHPESIVELSEWSSRVTLDIIGVAAMGREFNAMRDGENEIAQAYLEILEPSREKLLFFALSVVMPQWLALRGPLGILRKYNKVVSDNVGTLRRVCTDIVRDQRRLKASEDSETHKNILSSMIQKGNFTDEELVNQMLTFLAAGHETTASAMTWACYLLAKHPDIQERLRQEIRTKIPSRSHQITAAELEALPLLNGVCNETLRLFPTVPSTARRAIRDTMINGQPIKKNTLVLLVIYAVNRNPEMWADGDAFRPERWVDLPDRPHMPTEEKFAYFHENPDAILGGRPNHNGGASSNYAKITFLHGPRQCIAANFAHAELRSLIAGLVGALQWELADPGAEVAIAGVITTKPRDGMWLKMKALDGW